MDKHLPNGFTSFMSIEMRKFNFFEVLPTCLAYRLGYLDKARDIDVDIPCMLYIICNEPSGFRCLIRLKIKSIYAICDIRYFMRGEEKNVDRSLLA